MLSLHMKDKKRARKIAEDLNKGFFSHGDAVSRTRAIGLNLNVAERDEKLEHLMWEAYLGLESYMQLNTPLNLLDVYLSDPRGAAAMAPVPKLSFPPAAPPQLVQ